MKKATFVYRQKRFFQRNPSFRTGEIYLRWVKSLRGEIPLRGVRDGFHFTRGRSPRISPMALAVDFTAAGAAISLLLFQVPYDMMFMR
jgi:hypothetical protein